MNTFINKDMLYKVVKQFNDYQPGTVIELNERRAKSEIGNGNVVEYKEEKLKYKTKEEKKGKTYRKKK